MAGRIEMQIGKPGRMECRMAFDFKKEYKDLYQPKKKPSILTVPPMNYLAVRGKGDPNAENGEYKAALEALYAVAYTIRMSAKSGHAIEGFFDYVVPPLEGLWKQEGHEGSIDFSDKASFSFVSMIRLPDFVRPEDVEWAIREASKKKKKDFSNVEWFRLNEGLCMQCLHVGPYDTEPATIEAMDTCAKAQGYVLDLGETRMHHEIYLSNPQRTAPEKLKTIIRHPIRKTQ